jgi:hypothetical protein
MDVLKTTQRLCKRSARFANLALAVVAGRATAPAVVARGCCTSVRADRAGGRPSAEASVLSEEEFCFSCGSGGLGA